MTPTPDEIDDPAGRFRLRPWQPADVEQLTAIWQDPALTDRFPVDVPFTVESARRFVASVVDSWRREVAFHLAIVSGDDPATVLGGCDLSGLDGADPPDVGYWLAPAARGRGLATLVVGALVEWAATQLSASELALEVEPDNEPSVAVAERNGFLFDGTERHDDVRGRPRTLRRYRRALSTTR
jgi:ribosomal-protein-alanine N-acetyltransferase